MHISVEQPFSLAHSFESGQAFRWQRLGDWYYGVLYDNIIKIRQGLLGLEFYSFPGPEAELENLLRYYLRLDDDLLDIYEGINLDDRMDKAISKYHGLRLLRQEPWECLISFLLSISSNISRISATIEALCRRFGDRLVFQEHVRFTFPTPGQLAGVGEVGLRLMGIGFRSKYVANTAKLICKEDYDLGALRELSYQDAKRELLRLPGVGEKVADCVLLFSLDKLEAFPIDRWVKRAVEGWYFEGGHLSYKQMQTWASNYFGPYAGYAQQYLFHRRRLQG